MGEREKEREQRIGNIHFLCLRFSLFYYFLCNYFQIRNSWFDKKMHCYISFLILRCDVYIYIVVTCSNWFAEFFFCFEVGGGGGVSGVLIGAYKHNFHGIFYSFLYSSSVVWSI